jgi:two-component system, OmpR family, response regulator
VATSANTVLVVDDDASIRLLCRLNLEFDGWQVREAASLPQAREQFADDVAVVLLDMHLGAASGADFLGEVRGKGRDVKVALLTGSVNADAAGADALIPKPFTLEQLRSTVARLAARPAPTAG